MRYTPRIKRKKKARIIEGKQSEEIPDQTHK